MQAATGDEREKLHGADAGAAAEARHGPGPRRRQGAAAAIRAGGGDRRAGGRRRPAAAAARRRRRPRRTRRQRRSAGDVRAAAASRRITEEERKNAKLPLPPEQDSQVQALLRPGLLADVEIIVEKIPDALHVPAQAVFEKNGKPTVFVQQKNGKFEPREVQLMKHSESMMVLSGGVQAGRDHRHGGSRPPTRTRRTRATRSQSGGGPMSGMPASK